MEATDIQALATALQNLQPNAATVNATAVKLPSFWSGNPEVWFKQVESVFSTRHPVITRQQTKFDYVIQALDNITADRVQAIILSPPENPYDKLKATLIGVFGKSQAEKDQELLNFNGLGDRKPSELLQHMQNLNADPATLFKALFLAQLPPEVRRILALSEKTNIAELAREADRITEVSKLTDVSQVNATGEYRKPFGQRPVGGHRVSRDGILPLPSKVRAISDFPAPTTVTSLEQFVGMVNFYHVFVPKAAEVMKPLYKALSTKPRPKELEWTSELDLAFQKAKRLLADATLLHHPVPGARTVLTTDASDIAIGAVLEQRIEEHWQPLAFFSRQLNKAERNYSTIDRELLGIHSAVLHFRYFLEGRDFTVYTDHKPIVAAIKKKSELKSGRQSRHLATISEFTTDIQHVSGKDNVVADALSRASINPGSQQAVPLFRGQDVVTSEFQQANYQEPGFLFAPVNAIKPGLDYRAMATDQQNDPDIQNYRTAITNLRLEDVPVSYTHLTLPTTPYV